MNVGSVARFAAGAIAMGTAGVLVAKHAAPADAAPAPDATLETPVARGPAATGMSVERTARQYFDGFHKTRAGAARIMHPDNRPNVSLRDADRLAAESRPGLADGKVTLREYTVLVRTLDRNGDGMLSTRREVASVWPTLREEDFAELVRRWGPSDVFDSFSHAIDAAGNGDGVVSLDEALAARRRTGFPLTAETYAASGD